MTTALRMAQYGTKHGHAIGKIHAMLGNPAVELAGVYEPDRARRESLIQSGPPFDHIHWYQEAGPMLDDPTITAIASEGRNDESLAHSAAIIDAGKHLWYDKPAGDEWPVWQQIVARARDKSLKIQMGYMFRYHAGFARIGSWVHDGTLGRIFKIRAQMSTNIGTAQREAIATHSGGIFYDLAGHMLDQIVWLLGRPTRVQGIFRHDDSPVAGFEDNTVAILEFGRALAIIDIAAMEARPAARRFEVYGTAGSAIMEPFEPAGAIRLCLEADQTGYAAGEQRVAVEQQSRQHLYELELAAFLATIDGRQAPDRTLEHELLVQETLLRIIGGRPEA